MNKGFTLIEVLVSLVILSMITIISSNIFEFLMMSDKSVGLIKHFSCLFFFDIFIT